MLAGLFVAIALLAEVAGAASAYGPSPPAPPPPPSKTTPKPPESKPPESKQAAKPADGCASARASANRQEIVVCVQRPQGYRLDPDVMEAKREMRGGGRPKRPDRMKDTSCAVVGAAGCIGAGAGINLIGAALTAAEMAARLSKGQEIGSMFVTDPQPTEYQLYLEAKRRREAKEAQVAAVAKAKAIQAAKAANTAAAAKAEPRPDAGSRQPGP